MQIIAFEELAALGRIQEKNKHPVICNKPNKMIVV